ncbi:MAG: hypothetical protein M0R80_04175 [Proteobacteria bacterium]|jgi:hypothetical protein|nr:hypothetical protein [Pseudomonadota bacterium]
MFNPLYEIKEMLINLDGLKDEEIKIEIEKFHNIIIVPRIKTETYLYLKNIGLGITENFDISGKAIKYYIFVRWNKLV